MSEVVTKVTKVMSNELAMILMNRRPETIVYNTKKILSDKNMDYTKKIEVAREYLNLLAAEIEPEPVVVHPEVKVKKPPRYNRIPFETKMSMIEYYINHNCKKVDVARKFGICEQTCNKILLTYEREHPEMFGHK